MADDKKNHEFDWNRDPSFFTNSLKKTNRSPWGPSSVGL